MGRRVVQLCFALCLTLDIMLSACLLLSCDIGLRTVGMQIISYPDRLVYIKGVDTGLDLRGGVYRVEQRDGYCYDCDMNDEKLTYTLNKFRNIDFNRPGIYRVSIESSEFECFFPIQVVSPEDYGISQNDIEAGGFVDE